MVWVAGRGHAQRVFLSLVAVAPIAPVLVAALLHDPQVLVLAARAVLPYPSPGRPAEQSPGPRPR